MPKFVTDEDVPRSVANALKDLGYEVKDVRDHGLRGADDEAVYEFAQENQAVLISGDMGFGNILHFPVGSHFGIVIAHFPNTVSTGEIARQLVDRFSDLSEGDFRGSLIVIEPGKVRIRKSQ